VCQCNVDKEVREESEMNDSVSVSIGTSDVPADGHETGDVSVDVVTTRSQAASKLRASGELSAPSVTSNSGEKMRECQYQIELTVS
jgi:hypothetical protein